MDLGSRECGPTGDGRWCIKDTHQRDSKTGVSIPEDCRYSVKKNTDILGFDCGP